LVKIKIVSTKSFGGSKTKPLKQLNMIKAGCMLQADHELPEFIAAGTLDSPASLQWLEANRDKIDKARIIRFQISEVQARKIVKRLWPGEGLLGATCGRGFSIETPEQVAIINEILAPDISIFFSENHKWMLQTWPE
jgi:hypothetical protein